MRATLRPYRDFLFTSLTSCGLIWMVLAIAAQLRATPSQVAVTVQGGNVSMGATRVYFGKYVAQSMDYGFIWLDTEQYVGGYVGVAGRCGLPVPPPATGRNFAGDCNGVGMISYNGGLLVAGLGIGGQCSVFSNGCSGTKIFVWPGGFTPGTWAYTEGPLPCQTTGCPDSGQTRDPQGRTWALSGTVGQVFVWNVTGGGPTPTPNLTPPVPTVTPTQTPTGGPETPTPVLTPTATCSDSQYPYGKPGPFGYCYNCAGDPLGPQPCGPSTTLTPTPTVPPVIPTAPPVTPISGVCEPDLMFGRFRVTAKYTNGGQTGVATYSTLTLGGPEHRFFSFFNTNNIDLTVKLWKNGTTGHYVVFIGALTSVKWEVTVTNVGTGKVRGYTGQTTALFDDVSF